MPTRLHLPVPEGVMYEEGEYYTICRVLRDIYQRTNNDQIKLDCRVATAMAKAMSQRLRKYKDDASRTDKGFWDKIVT